MEFLTKLMPTALTGCAIRALTAVGLLGPLMVTGAEIMSRPVVPGLPAEDRRRIDLNQDGIDDFEIRHERTDRFLAVRLVGFTHLLSDDPAKPILGHARFLGHYAPGMRIPDQAPVEVPQEGPLYVFGEFARAALSPDGTLQPFTAAWDSAGRLFLGVTVDTRAGRVAGYLEFRAGATPDRLPILSGISWAPPPETGIAIYPGHRQFEATVESAARDGVVLSWPVQPGFEYFIDYSRYLQTWDWIPFQILDRTATRIRAKVIPEATAPEGGFFRIKAFPGD